MFHKATIAIIFLLAVGCGPLEQSTNRNGKQNSRLVKSCYLGLNGDNKECLETLSLNGQEGYEYISPADPDFPGHLDPHQYQIPSRLLKISDHHFNTALAPHFIISEFLQERKGPLGFIVPHVIEKLETMRTELNSPIRINSGYRSPGYNSTIPGAAKWSRHMYGDAIDFKADGSSFEELKDLCLSLGASFYQIYQSHIHCDWRSSPLDPVYFSDSHNHDVQSFSSRESYERATAIIELKNRRRPQLTVSHPEPEDGIEGLTYLWKVTMPNGKVKTYRKAKIKLPAQEGQYKTQVTVGGSITVNHEFYWSR